MNSIAYLTNKVEIALREDYQKQSKDSDSVSHVDPSIVRKDEDDGYKEFKEEVEVQTPKEDKEQDTVKATTTPFIIQIILFLPNLFIIKPLKLIWAIITFPLTLLQLKKQNKSQKITSLDFEEPKAEVEDETADQDEEENVELEEDEEDKFSGRSSFDKGVSNTTILELDEDTPTSIDDQLNPKIDPISLKDVKSPTSPSTSLLSSHNKLFTFPKTIYPVNLINSPTKKTLILDLDETLVHSLSRGTRLSNGHMIEVKLKDQVATLYYVHKRPYCDLFLKQVSKWFNLVIFTASVKEYADPIIDWLETERNYFSKRYYRNHCTVRIGQGYIKDLSNVDKSLNNVIIVDNSPISYALNEQNAIIVEGWINDPSDSDLLNLIPMLNGLRYTTDVRAILSLKNGEVAFDK